VMIEKADNCKMIIVSPCNLIGNGIGSCYGREMRRDLNVHVGISSLGLGLAGSN